ncbi:hypothetical protein DIPPA_51768 [Diplonema papillatum]|nr:hypothetical protein DIPPA_51768 [Diplonema papillatum]
MSGEQPKEKVLVLCTGNSCRSQMAEGLISSMLGSRYEVASAGTAPADQVHPMAVKACGEIGVDISANKPKHVDEIAKDYDHVITVCANAQEKVPSWVKNTVHIGFEDPAYATGTEEEKMAMFRQVRDEIRERLVGHLDSAGGVKPAEKTEKTA